MPHSFLITGASSGLGLTLARTVLAQGHSAVLGTRSALKARTMAPDIEQAGGVWLELSFTDPGLEDAVSAAMTQHNVDVLVNNAGYPLIGALEDVPIASFRAQFETNFFGPLRLIQAATPLFRKRGGGTIVNVGSSVAYNGIPGTSAYASSKAALRNATEGLATELAPFNIRVLAVEPGRLRTDFNKPTPDAPLQYSPHYAGTPAGHVVDFLSNLPPASGDPAQAALRIVELVTKTGVAEAEEVAKLVFVPLGSDSLEALRGAEKALGRTAEVAASIAASIDIE